MRRTTCQCADDSACCEGGCDDESISHGTQLKNRFFKSAHASSRRPPAHASDRDDDDQLWRGAQRHDPTVRARSRTLTRVLVVTRSVSRRVSLLPLEPLYCVCAVAFRAFIVVPHRRAHSSAARPSSRRAASPAHLPLPPPARTLAPSRAPNALHPSPQPTSGWARRRPSGRRGRQALPRAPVRALMRLTRWGRVAGRASHGDAREDGVVVPHDGGADLLVLLARVHHVVELGAVVAREDRAAEPDGKALERVRDDVDVDGSGLCQLSSSLLRSRSLTTRCGKRRRATGGPRDGRRRGAPSRGWGVRGGGP